MSDHVSSGSDLNAPLGQLLEPISSSETRDVKPGLERKSSNLAISAPISNEFLSVGMKTKVAQHQNNCVLIELILILLVRM